MKLLLVDDHALFREGLVMLLGQAWPAWQWQAVGTLAEARAALAADPAIDLVLLDLELPDSSGLASLARLREAAPAPMVVVLSADERPQTVLAAIDAGAAGFVGKSADAGGLVQAMRTVLEGGVVLPPQVRAAGAAAGAPAGAGAADIDLTPRQCEVLHRVLQGQPNKLIARELDMALSTVKTHLSEIYRRLGVRTRTQAVVEAAHLGLRFERLRR